MSTTKNLNFFKLPFEVVEMIAKDLDWKSFLSLQNSTKTMKGSEIKLTNKQILEIISLDVFLQANADGSVFLSELQKTYIKQLKMTEKTLPKLLASSFIPIAVNCHELEFLRFLMLNGTHFNFNELAELARIQNDLDAIELLHRYSTKAENETSTVGSETTTADNEATPLFYTYGADPKVLEYNLLATCEETQLEVNWGAIFLCAVNNGNHELIKILLRNELVDPAKDDNYAVKLAFENSDFATVKLLLSQIKVSSSLNAEELQVLSQ